MSSFIKSPEKFELLKALPEPRTMWEYFLALTDVPRGSGNCEEVLSLLVTMGNAIPGVTVWRDSGENVIFRKGATSGLEGLPGVCMQGHIDMVCEAKNGVDFDFDHDPIKVRIVGDTVMGTDTTLGADNGIGVAMILAVFAMEDFPHPMIEAIFTWDEETELSGALALETGILKSQYLINLDSEEDDSVVIGCAGGFNCELSLPITKIPVDSAKKFYTLSLKGLRGGHSGLYINDHRANAICTIGRLLSFVDIDFHLVDISTENTHDNAIPSDVSAVVALNIDDFDKFAAAVEKQFITIRHENKFEVNMAYNLVESAAKQSEYLNIESTKKSIMALLNLPTGVIRLIPDDMSYVETSISFAFINLKSDVLTFFFCARSSSNSMYNFVYQSLKAIAHTFGMQISDMICPYPGWELDHSDPFAHLAAEAYTEVVGKKPKIVVCHGGLECGVISSKYPSLRCISFGPEIHDAHSHVESVFIRSSSTIFDVFKQLMGKLSKK